MLSIFQALELSREGETLSFFDGPHETLVKDLFARVLRQVELVEARVALRQSHRISGDDLLNLELLGTVHSLQQVEALDGYPGTSRHELQEVALLCAIEGVHDLPEPHDLWRGGRVSIVVGAGFEIGNYKRKRG